MLADRFLLTNDRCYLVICLLVALFFIGPICKSRGQVRAVSSKVIGSEFRTKKSTDAYEFWNLPEAKIFWKDSLIGTTDEEGQFRIELAQGIDAIKIAWIGMYPETIRITENCDFVEVILLPDAIYDFVTAKKEARSKKKDREILPEVYRKAFENGIFKREAPCR